jgi:methylmalonyl-CoA/ethylmalonyl-CoA epimerase
VIRRIQHIGLAVKDLDAAIAIYERAFGLSVEHRERSEAEGIEAAMFCVGDVGIELIQPLSDDSPVGKFIARRGEGVHHVAFAVDDVRAELEGVKAAGLEPLDSEPRPGLHGTRVGFIHPKSASGVLIELVGSGENS